MNYETFLIRFIDDKKKILKDTYRYTYFCWQNNYPEPEKFYGVVFKDYNLCIINTPHRGTLYRDLTREDWINEWSSFWTPLTDKEVDLKRLMKHPEEGYDLIMLESL